jgi:hypothetical protein
MREEARGAHTAFRDSCDSGSHGMMPSYNPANAKPRGTTGKGGNWIAAATKNKGGLHRSLGVPVKQKIPDREIAAAVEKGGRVGKQARLAQTLATLRK